MTMAGISPGLFLGATVVLLALTKLIPWLLEARRGNPGTSSAGYRRLDLLGNSTVRAMVKARPFQFFLRLPFVFLFLFILCLSWFAFISPPFPAILSARAPCFNCCGPASNMFQSVDWSI